MKSIQGLKILLKDTRYNYSFLLSLVATGIISMWLVIFGTIAPDISDPVQGVAISTVVSFQYFTIVLVVLSLLPAGREMFFGEQNRLRNQVILSVLLILLFMVLGWTTYIVGPFVGAALTFCDAVITAYFTVLLGWNIGKSVYTKVQTKPKVNWVLFLLFAIIDFAAFGGVYMVLGLSSFPFEQQIVLLMFPLGILLLPILTIVLRNPETGPDQTSLMTLILFGFGLYYTYRLISITGSEWSVADIALGIVLLIYGLSSTVAKVNESVEVKPTLSITLVLFVILSRIGAYVNKLLAEGVGWGPVVQVGITSFTILNLAILGFLVPVYWMWTRKKQSSPVV